MQKLKTASPPNLSYHLRPHLVVWALVGDDASGGVRQPPLNAEQPLHLQSMQGSSRGEASCLSVQHARKQCCRPQVQALGSCGMQLLRNATIILADTLQGCGRFGLLCQLFLSEALTVKMLSVICLDETIFVVMCIGQEKPISHNSSKTALTSSQRQKCPLRRRPSPRAVCAASPAAQDAPGLQAAPRRLAQPPAGS